MRPRERIGIAVLLVVIAVRIHMEAGWQWWALATGILWVAFFFAFTGERKERGK